MIDEVFKTAIALLERGEKGAMSTIIASKGSLPMSEKSKMLVTPEGKIVGTVGGGCLEADVWAEACRVMEEGKSRIQQFILTEKYAGESGLNCGGIVEILTEPLPEQGVEIFRTILQLKETGHRGTLATILSDLPRYPQGRRKLLLCDDGRVVGSFGDPALEAFVQEQGRTILQGEQFALLDYTSESGEAVRLFLEPILPTPTVYVFGGGHVSFFVVRAAKLAGFRVKVIDDRPAFANKERFPEADETIVMDFDRVGETFSFGQDDYVVLVTRGHQHDQRILEQIYAQPARYIGMIGSKSKIAKMWKRLEAKGVPRACLERVHAPIGLNIGADTPEEIAISIVAELIRERRLGKVEETRRKRSHDPRREVASLAG
ncbi:MAG: xanthine dehydrogenase [Candidatus Tectimicrobiota bacterium]|nr:MAG: xanthine dehydrogenase [Candidatus Tectomicrobia bacterium]